MERYDACIVTSASQNSNNNGILKNANPSSQFRSLSVYNSNM